MTSPISAPGSDAAVTAEERAVMERNGITLVAANQYHVDGYRYSNLADALAQVNRGSGARAGL